MLGSETSYKMGSHGALTTLGLVKTAVSNAWLADRMSSGLLNRLGIAGRELPTMGRVVGDLTPTGSAVSSRYARALNSGGSARELSRDLSEVTSNPKSVDYIKNRLRQNAEEINTARGGRLGNEAAGIRARVIGDGIVNELNYPRY